MSTIPPLSLDRLRAFALVGLELVLILLFVYQFEIEEQKYFFPMLCFAVGGFAIHSWTPRKFQAWLFVLLSLAGILFILGLPNGSKIIAIGLGLIGVCHLPIPILLRAVLLLLAGGALAGLRIDYPGPLWPVLGSMFMFRLIVYLFELRRAEAFRCPVADASGSPALVLAYFFPLPNICFALFPVLDYQTFRETYYDEDDYTIYQTGVAWIVRGLTHLIAYRLIKYYVVPAPHQLRDLAHIALYIAGSYALYLRVSGWFHLITGILHLFGFNVPRTHQNYFLASSVSDIWRRINIYWKDFMTKVFFFPAFFALRRYGTRPATVAATLCVFVATWLLHSYQTFWLLGDLPITRGGAVLWLSAGILVAISFQWDLRRSRSVAKREPAKWRLGVAVTHSLKILGTFSLVSFFWACWTDPRFVTALRIPNAARENLISSAASLIAVVVALVAAGVIVQWLQVRWIRDGVSWPLPTTFPRSVAIHSAVLVVALVLGLPQVAGVFGSSAEEMAATLRQSNPTIAEAGHAMLGYYEELAETHVQAGAFLGRLSRKDEGETQEFLAYQAATREVGGIEGRELIPGWRGILGGAETSINEFGMRDREGISRRKPANTCRIALVGSSVVMGFGVADDQVFKNLLEKQLNSAAPPAGPHYELLNFGVGLSFSLQRRVIVETKVFGFEPDVLFFFAHQDELEGASKGLANVIANGIPVPQAGLAEALRAAGITSATPKEKIEIFLMPYGREIVLAVYRGLVEQCRQRGILPVWIYVPIPGITQVSLDTAKIVKIAEEAGFVVVNLADWADGHTPAEVKLSRADQHPNALGHRIIAERLFAELRKRPELLPPSALLRP